MSSLIEKINSSSNHKRTSTGRNIAIRIEGSRTDITPQRLYGTRIDTKEKVEVFMREVNSNNQPQVSDIISTTGNGGSVLLSNCFIDNNQSITDESCKYVLNARWATKMNSRSDQGHSFVATARVMKPRINDDGDISTAVDILLKGEEVKDISSFQDKFFKCFDINTPISGSHPFAAVRLLEKSENIEGKIRYKNSAMRIFQSVRKSDGSWDASGIEENIRNYTGGNLAQTERYNNIYNFVQEALKEPNIYSVEIVRGLRFVAGPKTKSQIANHIKKNSPAGLYALEPGEIISHDNNTGELRKSDFVGFAKYAIALRRTADNQGHICTLAHPIIAQDALFTTAGVLTERELADHKAFYSQQAPVQQQAPVRQQAPAPQDLSQFAIADSIDGRFIAILPPNKNPSIEDDIRYTLSQVAEQQQSSPKRWVFLKEDEPRVVETLRKSLSILDREGYSSDLERKGHKASTPVAKSVPGVEESLDMQAIGEDLNSLFGDSKAGMRQ